MNGEPDRPPENRPPEPPEPEPPRGAIPADVAAKILAADAKNAVENLKAGGTLPAALRKILESAALTPEAALQRRIAGHVERWMKGGDLTPEQWAEVIALHPQLASLAPANTQPPPPIAQPPPAAEPMGAQPFILCPDPPKFESLNEKLARWSTLYGSQARTVQRWIAKGKAANDPCPLDDPAAMPQWWTRHMTWSVPEKVLAAAKAAQAQAQAPAPAPATGTPPTPPPVAAAAAPPPIAALVAQLRLAEYELEEGQAVASQRKLVAALFSKLERAYDSQSIETDHIQTQFLKAAEHLRKLEASERKAELERGKYVLKETIDRDLAQAAEMLRQLHETRERRVLELCPTLTESARLEVAQALAAFSTHEQRIFRNLKSLKAPADVLAFADS